MPRSHLLKLAGITLSVLLLSVIGVSPYYADAQTQKYLSYENKQYGFSIKYPSTWEKTESLERSEDDPNRINIVTFAPSELTFYAVSLLQGDPKYKGLVDSQFLAQMDKEMKVFCSSTEPEFKCVSVQAGEGGIINHANGYKMYYNYYDFAFSTDEGDIPMGLIRGLIPDGNNIWELVVSSFSQSEFQQYSNDLNSIGQSFTIFDYRGEQTKSQSSSSISTLAKSSAGELQLNSGQFAVSKYSPAEVIVSGKIINYKQGVPVTLKIAKPDKSIEEQNVLVTKDGNFRMPLRLDNNWPSGNYIISAIYGAQNLGSVSFQVNTGDTKSSTSPTTSKLQQKQLQLYAKASQKNDIVYLAIKNSKDSSDDIYSIKLTTVNGKITNFIKIKDWTHKRLGSDSIMYQTIFSPLDSSDVIKITLKVDSKNTEIQWEAFSKDQKSLGTGKVKT